MDPLHELIRTMQPSEKGLFKKYSQRNGGGDYLKLFDFMASMPVYDEEKILRKFRKEPFSKHLARAKNYLQKAITARLADMAEETAPERIVQSQLREALILRNRGLVNEAAKMAARARALAEEKELFTSLMDCLHLQVTFSSVRPELKLTELAGEISIVQDKLININQFLIIISELQQMTSASVNLRRSELLERVKVIRAHPLLQDESMALSGKSKLRFNYVHYYIGIILADYGMQRRHAQRYLQIVLSRPAFNNAYSTVVLSGYNMVLSAFQASQEKELIEKHLEALRKHQTGNSWLEALKFQYYCIYAVQYYSNALNKNQFLETAAYSLKTLKSLGEMLRKDYHLSLYVFAAEGYMRFGMYSEAVDVIETFRRSPNPAMRFDYQNMLLFFFLICHYELGNFELVGNLIQNVKRFMKRTGEFSEMENKMFRVFHVLVHEPAGKARIHELEGLKSTITQMKDNNENVAALNNYSVIVPFIESKMQGVKYHKYIQAMGND